MSAYVRLGCVKIHFTENRVQRYKKFLIYANFCPQQTNQKFKKRYKYNTKVHNVFL